MLELHPSADDNLEELEDSSKDLEPPKVEPEVSKGLHPTVSENVPAEAWNRELGAQSEAGVRAWNLHLRKAGIICKKNSEIHSSGIRIWCPQTARKAADKPHDKNFYVHCPFCPSNKKRSVQPSLADLQEHIFCEHIDIVPFHTCDLRAFRRQCEFEDKVDEWLELAKQKSAMLFRDK